MAELSRGTQKSNGRDGSVHYLDYGDVFLGDYI